MPRFLYDAEIKFTDEFKILHHRYFSENKKYREAFPTFQEFYDWSMKNGFFNGAKLARRDPSKPYTPDNCYWKPPQEKNAFHGDDQKEFIEKWNKAVNRIRVHFGLKPL